MCIRDRERVAALALEPRGQLCGVGGLAGALEAGHEYDGGPVSYTHLTLPTSDLV